MNASDPLLSRGGWRMSLLVGLFAATVWAACFQFPLVWRVMGIGEENRPFLDLYGLLASIERAEAGFDSFQLNPLDPYRRPNVYTEWWLLAAHLGINRTDTLWLGVLCVGLTLLTALAVLKPVTRREAVLAMLVLVSPALLLAVNRANNDLVIFSLVSVALLILRAKGAAPRALGIVLFAISAVLKYYPLAALVVLIQARSRREFVGWLALYGLVLAMAWPALSHALVSASRFKPRTEWVYAFGASTLWRNFHWENPLLWLIPLVFVFAWSAWSALRDPVSSSPTAKEVPAAEREFLVGSAFLAALFILGGSYAYKLVFALWLLPWLWRAVLPPAQTRWRRVTLGLLLAVLWVEGLSALSVNLLDTLLQPSVAMGFLYLVLTCQQVLTWLLMACLSRWLFLHIFRGVKILAKNIQMPSAAEI